jgi:tripartite-type tricarboxylate transporter receptor subunit TctC
MKSLISPKGLLALLTLSGLALTALALEAGYPSKPLKMIVPYEPGGGVDIMGRLLARHLSNTMGQSIFIDNKPGGGGVVGTQALVSSPADGYTLILASTSPIVVAPFLVKKLTYNPLKDLQAVSLIANNPAILLVEPNSPFNTLAQIIAKAKSEPGQLTFSSSGIGGTGHLSAQLLKLLADVDLRHIAYKGTGPATMALMSSQVDLSFTDLLAGMKFAKNGQLKAIAVTSAERLPLLPQVPAMAETVPGYVAGVWYGVFVPNKTSPEIVNALNLAITKTLKSPEMINTLGQDGVTPLGGSPESFKKFIVEETERWGSVIRKTHVESE